MADFYAYIYYLPNKKDFSNIDKIMTYKVYKKCTPILKPEQKVNTNTLKYSPPDISDEEKIPIFKEILTTWNNEKHISFNSDDLNLSPMLKFMKTKSNWNFTENQIKYQMRGFYKYIALLSNKKEFSNINKITSTQTYYLSTKHIKTSDVPISKAKEKRKNENVDDEIPPAKKSKLDSTYFDYIKSLSINVFLMLYNMEAINLRGEYIKQVTLTMEQLKEINNTETIIKLAKMDLIYFMK